MSDLFPTPTDLPQGVFRTGDGGAEWRVWAPHAKSMSLVIWRGTDESVLPMQNAGDGYFVARASPATRRGGRCQRPASSPDAGSVDHENLRGNATNHVITDVSTEQAVEEGLRYAYRFPTGQTRPDPASRWQPDGVHAPSAVYFPHPPESERKWHGVPLSELVIYELHVGTFTAEGTFDAIVPRLEDLVSLGVTAIELMPIAQFPGSRNWGYDGVHLFAVQNSYGGPQGLLRLVDAAHEAGLGVILDVVYNHLGPEGNYIGEFGPYYSDRHHTPWGNAINYDGPDGGPIRRLVIDNAVSWVRDFGLDGLRLDAIQTIYDLSAKHLLAELQEEVQTIARQQQRHIHVIGETNQNDSRLILPPDRGGYGLDGIWADDLHHSVHALLTGEKDGYYVDFGRVEHVAKVFNDAFVYDGRYSRYRRARHGNQVDAIDREKFVVCIQNHDQIGNRPQGDRLSTLVSDARQRLAAALMLISPFTPLLFMGEEYGENAPFPFFCSFQDESLNKAVRRGRRTGIKSSQFRISGKLPDPSSLDTFDSAKLSWRWEDDPGRSGLRQMYQRLLSARKTWPALRDHMRPMATVIESPTGNAGTSKVLQLTYEQLAAFVVFANLSASTCPLPNEFADHTTLFTTWDGIDSERPQYRELLQPFELRVLNSGICGV